MRYHFGSFCFDTDARALSREGMPVHLPPKSFGMLEVLLESHPGAVAKDELLDRLWPGLHVSEASLARVASELRTALGESAHNPSFLQTRHGYGYVFHGEVRREGAESPGMVHVVALDQRQWLLQPGDNIIGRGPEAAVSLDIAEASRRHCLIHVEDSTATLEDLASKNGTFVGGSRVTEPVALVAGDVIGVGPLRLVYGGPFEGSTITQLSERKR